jgi:hypothetical protein
MTRNGKLHEGRNGTARVVAPTGRLFRPDRARGIDRIIDYFGGSFDAVTWRPASPRDRLPISEGPVRSEGGGRVRPEAAW